MDRLIYSNTDTSPKGPVKKTANIVRFEKLVPPSQKDAYVKSSAYQFLNCPNHIYSFPIDISLELSFTREELALYKDIAKFFKSENHPRLRDKFGGNFCERLGPFNFKNFKQFLIHRTDFEKYQQQIIENLTLLFCYLETKNPSLLECWQKQNHSIQEIKEWIHDINRLNFKDLAQSLNIRNEMIQTANQLLEHTTIACRLKNNDENKKIFVDCHNQAVQITIKIDHIDFTQLPPIMPINDIKKQLNNKFIEYLLTPANEYCHVTPIVTQKGKLKFYLDVPQETINTWYESILTNINHQTIKRFANEESSQNNEIGTSTEPMENATDDPIFFSTNSSIVTSICNNFIKRFEQLSEHSQQLIISKISVIESTSESNELFQDAETFIEQTIKELMTHGCKPYEAKHALLTACNECYQQTRISHNDDKETTVTTSENKTSEINHTSNIDILLASLNQLKRPEKILKQLNELWAPLLESLNQDRLQACLVLNQCLNHIIIEGYKDTKSRTPLYRINGLSTPRAFYKTNPSKNNSPLTFETNKNGNYKDAQNLETEHIKTIPFVKSTQDGKFDLQFRYKK